MLALANNKQLRTIESQEELYPGNMVLLRQRVWRKTRLYEENGELTMLLESLPIRDSSIHVRLLLLKKYPILTKSVTSGILSALGNLLSQILEARKRAKDGIPLKEIDAAGATRYAVYGLFVTGPVSHYFYHLMEVLMSSTDPYCIVKRLLLDRLIFAPGFLLIFYFVMNILEFVNINFVPVEFRVLFANMVAMFWYAYLASVRK